jgi:curved DNA-binding protein CbpA
MRDLYSDLHVPPSANRDAIHASFRTLARHWHPDFGGDSERMQAINDAWAVLGRPDRRAAYDQQRAAERIARQQAAAAGATPQTVTTPEPAVAPKPRDPNALDYGRYEGWTIEALANHDPDYLEWLRRSPSGRGWRTRIDAALAARAMRTPPPQAPVKSRGRFGR